MKIPVDMNCDNAMLCSETSTHACHAGTWIHSIKNWEHNEVGEINILKIDELWNIAYELGWRLCEKM